jgi:hypothetical protein
MASARSLTSSEWLGSLPFLLFVFFALSLPRPLSPFVPAVAVAVFVAFAAAFAALLAAVIAFFTAAAAFFLPVSAFLRAVSFLLAFLIVSLSFSPSSIASCEDVEVWSKESH